MDLPKYFLVNGRPVRFIPTADGGMDVEAIDFQTGEFVRAMEYLTRCVMGDTDVDDVEEDVFQRRVDRVRAAIA